MIGALFFLSAMDAVAKRISIETNTAMALWARYLGQTLIVAAICLPRMPGVLFTRHPRLQVLRSMMMFGATGFFFTAITYLGLAEATALMEVSPVLITLGGALLLGERLGPRRVLGIAAALIGALIVIRPGTAVFTPAALLPLAAAICYAGYALTTRFVGRNEDAWTSLFYTAIFGAIVLSAALPLFWVRPGAGTVGLMLAIGFIGAAGQLLLIRALQAAEAGVVAPFGYSGLLFATFWGWLVFSELPDGATVIGMAVIAGAGLYVWYRETRAGAPVAVAAPAPPAPFRD
ncbi:DMT family transporter [Palleronia sediminis]|uniref:DMT family transporter n=2 Tax=Palleronia sediminis TaxID=2547833 RepID=A0A4R6ADS9_9RHOB|nr:DMT family transporter [Palleronia sediminis]